jgi:hypothetical protein
VHEQQVVAVGHRVPAARGRTAARRVVLEEHRPHVAAGSPAEPTFGELELFGALQHDNVDVRVGQLGGRRLDCGGGPVPGSRPPAAPRAALGQRGQQIAVATVDERGGPGAVHVPDEDVHEAASGRAVGMTGEFALTRGSQTTLRRLLLSVSFFPSVGYAT